MSTELPTEAPAASPEDKVQQYSGGKPGSFEIDSDVVVCPWCGSEFGDCWEWVKKTPEEMSCDVCGHRFEYWVEYSAEYWSKPIKDTPDGSQEDIGEPSCGGAEPGQ